MVARLPTPVPELSCRILKYIYLVLYNLASFVVVWGKPLKSPRDLLEIEASISVYQTWRTTIEKILMSQIQGTIVPTVLRSIGASAEMILGGEKVVDTMMARATMTMMDRQGFMVQDLEDQVQGDLDRR